MATLEGVVHTVDTIESDAVDGIQVARILFNVTGTYVQADNAKLVGIPTLIQNSRRNGKTVTLLDVMKCQRATKASDPSAFMSLKTVAVSTNDVTFEITDADESTELAGAAVPSAAMPFGIMVAFTEA